MSIHLRPATLQDASLVSALVQETFREFVAPDWEPQARAHFLVESTPERFASLIPESAFSAVALRQDKVVGFILLPDPALLAFLFIHKLAIRQGIGAQLWEAARCHVESNHPSVKTVELNSSPYAVAAYKSLGFYPISEPFRRGGCLATRMACWLPGRALARGENVA